MKATFSKNNTTDTSHPGFNNTGGAVLHLHSPLLLNNPVDLLLLGVRIVVRLVRLPIAIINLLLRTLR